MPAGQPRNTSATSGVEAGRELSRGESFYLTFCPGKQSLTCQLPQVQQGLLTTWDSHGSSAPRHLLGGREPHRGTHHSGSNSFRDLASHSPVTAGPC